MAGKDKQTNEIVQEEKFLTKYDKKVQKRKEEQQRIVRRKRAVFGTGMAVLAACIVLVVVLIVSNISKSVSYIKVDDKSISKSEFNFYYTRVVNAYSSMYSMYYGLDTSKSLDSQQYSDSLTWKDYFEQMATDELVRVKAMVKEAKANDFDGDVNAEYEKYIKTLSEEAKANDMTEKEYYKQMFGDVKEDVEKYIKEYLLSNLWYDKVSEDKTPSDDEIEAYYQENKADYDYVNYYVTSVTAEGVTAGESTDDEISAAMEKAKSQAQTQLATLETDGEFEEYAIKSDLGTVLSDWLFDEARIANETTVLEDTDNLYCYAVKFVERGRDDRSTADIRAIITTDEAADADSILKEWEDGEKTEDSFIELVHKYSDDTSSEDGLYEGVTRVGMDVEGMTDWLFDEARKEGDAQAFVKDDTNYVVYYKGENDPDYKYSIRNDLTDEAMQEYVKNLTDAVKVADPNGVLKYLQTGE